MRCTVPTLLHSTHRKQGIRALAEALERNDRVRHVYVHAGGKVEALGTGVWAAPRKDPSPGGPYDPPGAASPSETVPLVTVETVCVVDVRDNKAASSGSERNRGAGGEADLARSMEDPTVPLPTHLMTHNSGLSASMPVFATSVIPGDLGTSTNTAAAVKSVKSKGEQRKRTAAAAAAAAAAASRKASAAAAAAYSTATGNGYDSTSRPQWCGRSGGLETRHTRDNGSPER
jgi:hypothetical protein